MKNHTPTPIHKTKSRKGAQKQVANKAGHNKAFGRAIDKLPHGSAARNKMAGFSA